MMRFIPLVFLLIFLSQDAPRTGDEPGAGSRAEEILELEKYIRANPGRADIESKRLALADLYFEDARLFLVNDSGQAVQEATDIRKSEAERYLKTASEIYLDIAKDWMKKADQYRSKRQAKYRKQWLRAYSLLKLKAGISTFYRVRLLALEYKPDKGMSQLAERFLLDASWTAPPQDPLVLWAWFYTLHLASESGKDLEARALTSAFTNPDHLVIDLRKSLTSRSPDLWLIQDPLEAIYLQIARNFNKAGRHAEALGAALTLLDAYRSIRAEPGPLGHLLCLEWYKASLALEGLSEAGKILFDAAGPLTDCGFAGELIPVLEDFVERCGNDPVRKESWLPLAVFKLGEAFRLDGRCMEALSCYDRFLEEGGTGRFIEPLRADAFRSKGLCCIRLERWFEGAEAFQRCLAIEKQQEEGERQNTLVFWHHCLAQACESTGGEVYRNRLEDAKKKLAARGLDPDASLPEVQDRPGGRVAAFPPAGVFGLSLELDPPSLSYRALSSLKPSGSEERKIWKAVQTALDWLGRHQDPDGFFSSHAFDGLCKGKTCTGRGLPLNDPAVTGLALLAILGAGESMIEGEYSDAARGAAQYLCDIQNPMDGCFGDKQGIHFMYNHAIACLAVTKAFSLCRWPSLSIAAEKGLAYIHETKNPGKAWRYNDGVEDPIQQNDVSVTGWMVRSLAAAFECGLSCDKGDLKDALQYIDDLTDPETGRTGYMEQGSYGSREEGDESDWPFEQSEAMTSVAVLCRFLAGRILDELDSHTPAIERGAELLRDKPPEWNTRSGRIDFYYWYYGTHALAELGGPIFEDWKEGVSEALIGNQASKGCAKGSWDPERCPWGDSGGRVYSTALCALTLEALFKEDGGRDGR